MLLIAWPTPQTMLNIKKSLGFQKHVPNVDGNAVEACSNPPLAPEARSGARHRPHLCTGPVTEVGRHRDLTRL